MGETVQLNCRNFKCEFNDKGKCRLEKITLQDDGSPIISQVICIEAAQQRTTNDEQQTAKDAKPVELETAWGIPKEDLPEQEPKNHFAQKDEELP